MKNITLIWCVLLLCTTNSSAQKRVLAYPKAYINPVEPYSTQSYKKFISSSTQKAKDKNIGWWVTVDRSGVASYEEPVLSSAKIRTLDFGEKYFVTQSRNGWYYLIDAIVDGIKVKRKKKDIGWVSRDNLLLWNESLFDGRKRIPLRCLTLNRFEHKSMTSCDAQEFVKVFHSPSGNERSTSAAPYEFCFIYKKENNRYLLGKSDMLNYYDDERLIGWVDNRQIAEWSTRIAMEPNFTEEGFEERKKNENFQVLGFNDIKSAEKYAQGIIEEDNIIWKNDPVINFTGSSSNKNCIRLDADVIRFPLLEIIDGASCKILRTIVFDTLTVVANCGGNLKPLNVVVGNKAYFPLQIDEASQPLLSPVLFIEHRDLIRFVNFLDVSLAKVSAATSLEKKVVLIESNFEIIKLLYGLSNVDFSKEEVQEKAVFVRPFFEIKTESDDFKYHIDEHIRDLAYLRKALNEILYGSDSGMKRRMGDRTLYWLDIIGILQQNDN